MSKKKSLGSSPIGCSTAESGSFNFISDLNTSQTDTPASYSSYHSGPAADRGEKQNDSSGNSENNTPDKKITSYYLEVELINRLKLMADDHDTYYSTLVNEAIQHWVEIHGY